MRLKQFQKELAKKKIGLALFFSLDGENPDPNLVYFTQYTGFGMLAITPKKALLLVPEMEKLRARKASKVRVVGTRKRLVKTLKQKLRIRPRKVGIDKNRMTLNFYKSLKKEFKASFVDVSGMCLALRTVKTDKEIQIMRRACAITDKIMHKTFWNFKKFKTEADVSAYMKHQVNKLGLGLAFTPVIASGKNACEPHHSPENKRLLKGFCVIDFGVRYKGYCSDITRTVYLGNPTRKEIDMYYRVLRVQEEMIQDCVPGASFVKINEKARSLFGVEDKYFTHLIGHGVGLDVHENPNPKKSSRRPIVKLGKGSVITIEPGLYYPHKSGIRIEDDVLVTGKGPKVLTRTGKNLLIIKK